MFIYFRSVNTLCNNIVRFILIILLFDVTKYMFYSEAVARNSVVYYQNCTLEFCILIQSKFYIFGNYCVRVLRRNGMTGQHTRKFTLTGAGLKTPSATIFIIFYDIIQPPNFRFNFFSPFTIFKALYIMMHKL